MGLAEDIAGKVKSKPAGSGFLIQTYCHGGDGLNLLISNGSNGKLSAKCFSNDCTYKRIMTGLEAEGLKPAYKETDSEILASIKKKRKIKP